MSKFNSSAEQLLSAIETEIRKSGRTDLAAEIAAGKKRAVQTTEFFRKNMNASVGDITNIYNLVEETTADDILRGARSISRGKLADGTIMAITKVCFEYGRDLVITDSSNIAFSNLIYSNVSTKAQIVPNKLLNSRFVIKHGTNIGVQGIFKDYFKAHDIEVSPGLGSADGSVYKEISPIYIADDKSRFQLTIELPNSGNMGATFIHHIGFKLDGLVIMDR
jgi:hypothetical protein